MNAEKIKQDFEKLSEEEKQSLLTYAAFLTTNDISNSRDDENKVNLWRLFNYDLYDVKLKLADILNITDFLFCSLDDLQIQNTKDYEKIHTLANVIDRFAKDAYERIDKVIETPLEKIVV